MCKSNQTCILFFIIIFSAVLTRGQPKIFLVRHSEKVEDWQDNLKDYQPLNEEGIVTSRKLAEYFKDTQLSAIYSSGLTRTLQTAYYISKEKKIDILVEDACNDTSQIDAFIESLNNEYKKHESVLIVSHSNIIPYFLIKFGLKKEEYAKMKFTLDNKWLVTDYYGELFIIERNKNDYYIRKEKFKN